jgi:hypothetical protein
MKRIHIFALIVSVVSCWLSALASAQTNFPGTIVFRIDQNAELNGTVSYTVRSSVFGAAPRKVLTAPDGITRFGPGPGLQVQASVSSFLELSQRFFGTWNIFEDSTNPFEADSNYTFTLNPFSLNDVHNETPIVTSPATGSTVPTVFDVHWQYQSGNNPGSRSMIWHAGPDVADVEFAPGITPSATFTVNDELAPNPFTFRVGSNSPLAAFMTPVTLLNGHPRSAYSIQASFNNFSLLVPVTVVPEPTTAVLLGLGVMVLGCRRR